MMGAFGRFLEISVPTGDILRSLAFYRALGFTELATGDIRSWHYAVVTDGSIALGLHSAGIEEPALAFVRPNLARQVRALDAAGHEFEFQRLGAEQFHEAGLRTPDGQLILMMEARTFSPGGTDAAGATVIGRCVEVGLGCGDVATTRSFFEAAGFLPAADELTEIVRLDAPGLRLGLRGGTGVPTLHFSAGDLAGVMRRLDDLDIRTSRRAEGVVLQAPEGTRLVISQVGLHPGI